MVSVTKNRSECINTAFSKVFGTGQRASSVFGQFRQHAAGVPLSIKTAGVRQDGEPRNFVAEPKGDVAVIVVTITVQPCSYGINFEVSSVGRMVGRPAHRQ